MENKYDSLKLENQLCFPIYLCSKELTRRYNDILKEYDLTYTQYIVMMYLWQTGKTNITEIGRTILLDSSTLTPLLKKLENKNFIKRIRSSKDERNLEITLTDTGIKLRDKVVNVPYEIGKCLCLTEKEAKTLYELTYKALINIERKMNDESN